MSPTLIGDSISESSPRLKARLAGFCYLICGTAYTFAEGNVRGKLVVWNDAAATAHNILAHETLYRWGFAAEIISVIAYIAVTLLLYELLRPVSRSVSLGAAVFSLVGCTTQAATSVLHLAPLVILSGDHSFGALTVEQLQGSALLSLKMRTASASIYMVLFGWYCLLLGYLILRAKFMPRIIGAFLAIAGLAYQLFLSPPLATRLFHSVIMPAGTLGEISLILWLLVFGVNPQKWRQQATVARMNQ